MNILSSQNQGYIWKGLNKYDLFLGVSISLIVTILFLPLFKKAVYVDDAFIYLRVVDNIINGHGWVYNINDSTDPCSSTFYTIFLVILAWLNNYIFSNIKIIHFSLDQIPALANIICVNIIALIQYFAYRKDRYKAFAISVSSAICGIFFTATGMESHLFIMLILSAALAYQFGHKILVGFLSGLIALTRPEGLAFISIPVIISLIFYRRFDFQSIVSWILTISPWYTFSWLYFGLIFPNPVYMKSTISSLFMVYPGMYFEAFVHQPIFPYITFPLFIIGCFKIFKNSKSLHFYPLIIIIFGTLQTIVYTIMVADPGFFWYFATANFGVNFAVVISMYWIFEYSYYFLVKRSYTFQKVIQKIKSNSIIPKLIKSVFAALIIITMLKVGISPVQKIKAYRNAEDYIKISKWILKNTKVADRVSCGEIGYIGFYTNRKMRDPFCLIHSRFGKEYLLSRKDYLWWFRKDPPEVIIAKYNIFTEKAYPFGIYNKSQELLNYFLKTYKTVYVSGKFHVWQRTG